MHRQVIISATERWLTSFIIAHNICPFARKVQENQSIRYQVVDSAEWQIILETLIAECKHLDAEPGTETSLLIFPVACAEFEDYLDLLAIAEQLLVEQGYEGVYQIASFHPDYCFDGEQSDDAANFTNRSPYPMLHIIREASIESALQNYQNPEMIPQRNIELTRKLGFEHLQAQFLRYFD